MADRDQQTEQQEKRSSGNVQSLEDLDVLDEQAGEVKGGGTGFNYGSMQQSYNNK